MVEAQGQILRGWRDSCMVGIMEWRYSEHESMALGLCFIRTQTYRQALFIIAFRSLKGVGSLKSRGLIQPDGFSCICQR